jgi:hypothetical protein
MPASKSTSRLTWLRAPAEELEQCELSTAVDHECEQRSGNAHDGEHDSHCFQRIGDGERAVEGADRFARNARLENTNTLRPARAV